MSSRDRPFAKALPLYVDEDDVGLAKIYAFDMKMILLVYASHFQWMMGYPDRALRTKQTADHWAAKINIPFMHVFAKIWGSAIFHYCGQLDDHRQQIEEALDLSNQIGNPLFVKQADMWIAWNRTMIGDYSDANVTLFESAPAHYMDTGIAALPYFSSLHAQALSGQGKTVQAIALLQVATERIEAIGEQSHAAEVHRIRATILARGGAGSWKEAEQAYLTSLAISRRQGAKSWELRTATSYARLLKECGRAAEARELLQPILRLPSLRRLLRQRLIALCWTKLNSSVRNAASALFFCYPCATQSTFWQSDFSAKCLKKLVAGAGFEPTTFRL